MMMMILSVLMMMTTDNDASSKNYEWQFLVKDAIDDIDMKKQKCLQGKTFNH